MKEEYINFKKPVIDENHKINGTMEYNSIVKDATEINYEEYLKFGGSIKEFAAHKLIKLNKIKQLIHCGDCNKCCTILPIIFTENDAWKMAKHFDWKLKLFKRDYLFDLGDGKCSFRKEPCLFSTKNRNVCVLKDRTPHMCKQYPIIYDLNRIPFLYPSCPEVEKIEKIISSFKKKHNKIVFSKIKKLYIKKLIKESSKKCSKPSIEKLVASNLKNMYMFFKINKNTNTINVEERTPTRWEHESQPIEEINEYADEIIRNTNSTSSSRPGRRPFGATLRSRFDTPISPTSNTE